MRFSQRCGRAWLALFALAFNAPAQQINYKLHGVGFSPYTSGQDPNQNLNISLTQIQQRLATVAPYTNWIRTFGCTNGLGQAGAAAKALGLKTAIGVWIGRDLAANDREVACGVNVANSGNADLMIVGSEVTLRRDVSESQLLAYMQSVRQQIPANVLITTADVYSVLIEHPNLIQASDVVLGNFYPYWEGSPVSTAIGSLHASYRRLAAASGSKTVLVSESGWPSSGNTAGAAVPSPSNAASYFLNFVSWARANNVAYFYFEAFDEAWKTQYEGPQGAAWGLWSESAVLKSGMQAVFDGQTVADNWSGAELPGGPGTPSLALAFVGPQGDTRPVWGQALHVKPADYKVALYIQVSGGWWTKPTFDQPLTAIQPDGSFTTAIVTGGNDSQATRVRAFLVPNGYAPPQANGGSTLPSGLDANAVATTEVIRGAHSICGRVTESGSTAPVAGVNLALTGTAVLSAQTVPTGDYCFPNLTSGASYGIMPSKLSTLLVPAARTVTGLNGNQTADFTAAFIPGAPTVPIPAHGSTGIAVNPTLSWNTTGAVTSNDVHFGTVNPPPQIANVTTNTYAPGALSASTTYYWQIISRNGAGRAASPVWSFTTANPPCTYTLNPESISRDAGAGTGSVAVTTGDGCQWTAASNSPWLTVTAGSSGTGPGTVSYSFPANLGTARSGGLTVAGKTFTVNQAAPVVSSTGLRFVPLTPCRVMDTRLAPGPLGSPSLPAGGTRSIAVASSPCGVPANAAAYSLNVTVVPIVPLAFLSMWPTGQARPATSLLNSFDGRIKANSAIVPAGVNGEVSVFATHATEVIIDVNGYFVPAAANTGLAFYPVPACRITDTRVTGPILAAGETRRFAIAPNCQLPVTPNAYSLNITVVPPGPLGFLTTWPAGQAKPFVSTLNALTGAVTANGAIVPAGAAGAIEVYVTNATDLIIDVNGFFAPPGGSGALSFYPVTPCRISDTRNPDGQFGGPVMSGFSSRMIPVLASSCGLPGISRAYAVNATAVPLEPLGYLTLWTTGLPLPGASTLNSFDGTVVSNSSIVSTVVGGFISAFASNTTHLILDVSGYFAP